MKNVALISGAALLLLAGGMAQAKQFCGEMDFQSGLIYDVREADPVMLNRIQGAHFTEEVEQGVRGTSGGVAAADIQYVLNAFPNHRRALEAVIRLAPRYKGGAIVGKLQSVISEGSFLTVPRGTSFTLARQGNRPLTMLWTLSGEPCETAK